MAAPLPGVTGIGSVRLSFGGHSRTENVVPYALFGDSNGDLWGAADFADGLNTLELTVFGSRNGKGDILETVRLDFSIGEDTTAPPPVPVADTATTDEDQPVTIDVVANDANTEGFTISPVSNPCGPGPKRPPTSSTRTSRSGPCATPTP